jgi:hypothetical protein
VARKYIDPDNLYVVLSGDAKEIGGKLKRFGRVEVVGENSAAGSIKNVKKT